MLPMVRRKMDGYRPIGKLAVLDAVTVDKVRMPHLLRCNTRDGWMLLQVITFKYLKCVNRIYISI